MKGFLNLSSVITTPVIIMKSYFCKRKEEVLEACWVVALT